MARCERPADVRLGASGDAETLVASVECMLGRSLSPVCAGENISGLSGNGSTGAGRASRDGPVPERAPRRAIDGPNSRASGEDSVADAIDGAWRADGAGDGDSGGAAPASASATKSRRRASCAAVSGVHAPTDMAGSVAARRTPRGEDAGVRAGPRACPGDAGVSFRGSEGSAGSVALRRMEEACERRGPGTGLRGLGFVCA